MRTCLAIPTYGREDVLLETIREALAQEPPADEVLVIDQTPEHEPATASQLKAWDEAGAIRWIRHSPPNLPGARNRALLETRSEIIAFIDDDVRLARGFVAAHAANYADAGVAAVAGRAIQASNRLIPARQRPWPREMDHRFFRLDATERVESVGNFQGCNHSIRVETARRLGGYDENFIGWAYREDSDMALRVLRSGGRIVFDPKAELTHLGAPSGGCRKRPGARLMDEWRVSFPETYFLWKHFFPRAHFWGRTLFWNVRRYVLRWDNVRRPWRLPWALVSYGWSIGAAGVRVARNGRQFGSLHTRTRL